MNLYSYIAENNTDQAVSLCEKNGLYDVVDLQSLSDSLRKLLAQSEEKAKEVLNLHPDKDVLLEIFTSNQAKTEPPAKLPEPPVVQPMPCGCNMLNADGNTQSTIQASLVNQTNMYILLGAVVVSLAIISIKK